jgi:Heavy-metal resistance
MMRSFAVWLCVVGTCISGEALAQTAPAPVPGATRGPRARGPNPNFGRGPGRGGPGAPGLLGPNAEARLTRQLGLNATQQNTLHTALASAQVQQQGMREKTSALRTQLQAAVKAGDEGAIDNVTRDMAELQQQQAAVHAKTLATVYASLSTDQKARFEPMMNRELGVPGPRPAGRGPGGRPGGRGPRPRSGAPPPAPPQ